jgi:hypothetical protein
VAAVPVLEHHVSLLEPDDRAAEPARRVLDHQAGLGDDLGHRAGLAAAEHVAAVVL